MASMLPPTSSLPFPRTFPRASTNPKSHAPPKILAKATDSDSSEPSEPPPSDDSDAAFEARLSRVRYRSGTGKKAELRKTRKSKSKSTSSSGSIYLPPVPLKEPVSSLGRAKVEFGFSPYSERVNGLAAVVGLAGLLSVELATGKSLISFHAPAVVLIQFYFMAAVTAIFVKYEKEKVSVWPNQSSSTQK